MKCSRIEYSKFSYLGGNEDSVVNILINIKENKQKICCFQLCFDGGYIIEFSIRLKLKNSLFKKAVSSFANIPCKGFITKNKNMKKIYVKLLKAIHRTLQAPLLWYTLFAETLQ